MHCTTHSGAQAMTDHHRRVRVDYAKAGAGARVQHHTGAGAALRGDDEAELQRIKDVSTPNETRCT